MAESMEPTEKLPGESNMEEKAVYFDMLRLWVNQTKWHQSASQCFPYYLLANSPQSQAFTNPVFRNQSQQPLVNGNQDRVQRDEALGANGGGFEYIIAPIWKRLVAEVIDIAILFLIKLLLTFAIVDILNIDLGTTFSLDTLKTSMEDDYSQLFNIASELIVLELITKVMVCIYETLWTMEGHNNMGGATPGKLVMGIRILFVESVILVDQDQPQQQPQPPPAVPGVANAPALNYLNNRVKALLYPARNPGWKRAFCRAFIKNATVIIPVVYPVYFLTFMFRNNRMGYDVLTKTIVVEENQVPVMRRL